MILKYEQRLASHLTQFDLLGNDEIGLSKAFAYVLAKDRSSLFTFLRFLGIHANNTRNNYHATSVGIERSRAEGRTDIEIYRPGLFHVIAECKINKNVLLGQRTQYLSSFEDVPNKIMCFITQERDTNKRKHNGITTRHVSWADILDVLDGARSANPIVGQFMRYVMRSYKMTTQKEILVQDLSDPLELDRYLNHSIYRRDVTFGTPLYFAPYFTRSVDRAIGEGIKYLSRVLGVLTLKPCELEDHLNDLEAFSEQRDQVEKWMQGVRKGDETHQKKEQTFYFLDKPVELTAPLLKEGTRRKGRGKNWIAAMIPKNRCVTFAEFVRRIMKAT